jgi:uncharacterized membrane protein
MSERSMAVVVTVVGAILLVLSLFADALGIGDQTRFGTRQQSGTVLGAVLVLVGLFLWYRARRPGP